MTEATYDTVSITRQPVFNAQRETWGHMILFRDSTEAKQADISDSSAATMQVIANLPMLSDDAPSTTKALVHFTPTDVIHGAYQVLPQTRTVVILEETAAPTPDLIEAAGSLRSQGYSLAINNFTGVPGGEELARQADIAMITMEDSPVDAPDRARKIGIPTLLAKHVETQTQFSKANQAGFDLFQGFFFKEVTPQEGRTISSAEITRLKLFEVIERTEADFDALTKAVETDVSISFRLLRFLNSPHFSFRNSITSIRQAVVLAGWNPIRNWLRLIILTDMAPSSKGQELTLLSAIRAKLFEAIALNSTNMGTEKADILFMLGLFSLLDAMLDMKMDDIVAHLPMDEASKEALCGKTSEYSQWLVLADAIEQSDWTEVSKASSELNISPGIVAVCYQQAFHWADSFFGPDKASG